MSWLRRFLSRIFTREIAILIDSPETAWQKMMELYEGRRP